MRPVNPTPTEDTVKIGAQLRATRLAQALTLEQLAKATGLTRSFLSRVERDDTVPSVPTLLQICQALSLPIGSLFAEPETQVIATSTAPRINMGGTGADERLVSPRSTELVQVIRSSLQPNAAGGKSLYTVNCEKEVLHVISGCINIVFRDREVLVKADETLTFSGRTPHNWHTSSEGAEVVWVLCPAAWSGSA